MINTLFVSEVTADNFDQEVLERSRQAPVLVDFWAEWCAPCKMLMPILAQLAEEHGGKFHLAKVDAGSEQVLARQYGVRSLPTVKLFKNGEAVDEFMGALPESEVREFLDRHVENETDRILQQARTQREAGDFESAQSLLQAAIDAGPGNDSLNLELAAVNLAAGETAAAEKSLTSIGRDTRNTPAYQALRTRLDFAELTRSAPDKAALEAGIQANPNDLEARYQLGARLLLEDAAKAAMEQFLEIVRRDRSFRDDAGRSALIKAFNLQGGNDPAVKRYRGLLARLLN